MLLPKAARDCSSAVPRKSSKWLCQRPDRSQRRRLVAAQLTGDPRGVVHAAHQQHAPGPAGFRAGPTEPACVVGHRRLAPVVVLVAPARQLAEQPDEFGIDAFAGREVLLVEVLGIVEVELRVGAQVFEELGKAAVKFDLLDDCHHFAAQALDFVEPDAVSLQAGVGFELTNLCSFDIR